MAFHGLRGVRMADANDIQENLTEWLENPSWAEYYNDAPSDRCRKFIALEFYYSEYMDEGILQAMDAIEDDMDSEDLRHLVRWCGNNPRKSILVRKIAEREGKGSINAK